MSSGDRIDLESAALIALRWSDRLRPYCSRIEVAGSIRRGCETAGDIELVVIGDAGQIAEHLDSYTGRGLFSAAHEVDIVLNGPKMKQWRDVVANATIDLFIATPEKWGVLFALRTGPAMFSRALVMQSHQGGLLRDGYKVRDGRVWDGQEALETPEERDFFKRTVCGWVEPGDRREP